MRIDVVSIFPDYLAPLGLSLTGKARDAGLLDVHVHDLRDWAHDRHRTVDDTPYGGGPGMVMRPEPWGAALDAVVSTLRRAQDGVAGAGGPVLVVPTPAGVPFTQRLAVELARAPWLVLACGRYEGIDQRVVDDARTGTTVREVKEISVGDYVLNGGEAAALVIVEAVVRLLPGFVGNPESLVEESHGAEGLLEAPVYTKPPRWRGLEVPAVLRSGDHARIAAWRREQSLRRTSVRRPELLGPSAALGDVSVRAARTGDAGELFTLQRACWVSEQLANPGVEVPALTESFQTLREWLADDTVLVAHDSGRLVGAVRARLRGDTWEIGRLMVAPDVWGRGLGRDLLARIESLAPAGVEELALVTGARSTRNLKMYKKAGYRPRGEIEPGVVRLTKRS
ncbi:MAG: tRNA (guanosine(37)-N1)-methyltransferase TrmD [Nocardioidaceae bacterium]